jgi:hypothetical protein
MDITSAQYMPDSITLEENAYIKIVEKGVTRFVPNNAPNNRHYAEIMRQVDAGTLTIQEAD